MSRTDTERLDFYFQHHMNNGGERMWEVDSPLGRMWMISLLDFGEWHRFLEQYDTFRDAIDEAMNRSASIGYGPVEEDDQ